MSDYPYTYTTSELLDIFSPSTLASVIADIWQQDKGVTEKQKTLAASCRLALIANVGETEAAGMIGEHDIHDEPTETFTCRLCRTRETGTMDALIDADWIPSYWAGDIEVDGPVCRQCADSRLTFNDDTSDFALIGTEPCAK